MKPFKIYSDNVEPAALDQFYTAMKQDFVVKGALMPDAHYGYTLPIGGIVACKGVVVPAYVGFDIGCGVCAYKTVFNKQDIVYNVDEIFDRIYKNLPVGRDGHRNVININDLLIQKVTRVCNRIGESVTDSISKLGTLGSGNHFSEIGYDEDGNIWIIVHSGSRHFGHSVANYYMKIASVANTDREIYALAFEAKNKDFKQHNPKKFEKVKKEFIYKQVIAHSRANIEGHYGLDVDSMDGKNYIYDMNVAMEYALENRKLIVSIILKSIQQVLYKSIKKNINYINGNFLINRNHNHAELKNGLWIHRKGATQAEKGMFGVIPGNMRDGSFIVEGKGNPDSLCSSSHGAGRAMSRNKAKKNITLKEFKDTMLHVKANVSDGTLDEAPMAYKDIFDVMELQKDLVAIKCYIKPILNVKGV